MNQKEKGRGQPYSDGKSRAVRILLSSVVLQLRKILGDMGGSNMSIAIKIIGIILIVVVSGCTSGPTRFTNYGATQEQFMKDRYECYRETQQRASSAYVNRYGGAARSQVIPSCSAFLACLASRGYLLSNTSGNLIVPTGAEIQCQD